MMAWRSERRPTSLDNAKEEIRSNSNRRRKLSEGQTVTEREDPLCFLIHVTLFERTL